MTFTRIVSLKVNVMDTACLIMTAVVFNSHVVIFTLHSLRLWFMIHSDGHLVMMILYPHIQIYLHLQSIYKESILGTSFVGGHHHSPPASMGASWARPTATSWHLFPLYWIHLVVIYVLHFISGPVSNFTGIAIMHTLWNSRRSWMTCSWHLNWLTALFHDFRVFGWIYIRFVRINMLVME